jgi:hypothetical protein
VTIRKKKDVVAILTLPCYHLQHGHTVAPKKRKRSLRDGGYQPGSATVAAVFQARCGRNSRISAGQMRSVADNLMENSKNSDGAEEEGALRPL